MKIITDDNNIIKAIEILKNYLQIKNEFNISFSKSNSFKIEKNENDIIIHYVKVNEIFYAIGQIEIENYNVNKCPFKHAGIMIDNARNGVSNIDSLKRMIINMAILGYNFVGLYLEDCLEVDNEPFFGYMRGRYSQNEIKEVDDFAKLFGIELIPYIQTLAHLNRIFNHYFAYSSTIHDMHDVLLMDETRTYELIENYISSVSKCFSSKHLHVGLDESFSMCEGKYKTIHQNFNKEEVFFRHVLKVIEIAKKYGFEVEAWGDMFLKHLKKKELPNDLTITLWSYYNKKEEDNDKVINEYKELTTNLSFASSTHKYYGFIPYNEYASEVIACAMKSCIKNNIERFTITMWGDDGCECGVFQTLPSLIKASSSMYDNDNYDLMSKFLTNYSYNELLLLDSPNKVFDGEFDRIVNPSRYLFYMDPFYGIDDRCENKVYKTYFDRYIVNIKPLLKNNSSYAYLFKFTYELLNVLSIKNNIRTELIDAYKNKNKKELISILKRLKKMTIGYKKFYKANEIRWLNECKPFGYEIMQVRLAGMVKRNEYLTKILSKKIKNLNYVIEELEQVNLMPKVIEDKWNGAGIYNRYSQNITYNTLMCNDYF